MSKSKTPTDGDGSPKSREKLAMLQEYYDLGRRASNANPDGTAKQPEPIKDLAVEAGVEPDTIRLASRFATGYTVAQLEELLALRDPAGEPFAWYLVRVLLQVKDLDERSKIQALAAAEGWSRQELRSHVQIGQGGKKSTGGRRSTVPSSPQQILTRLVELSESWLRFYADLGEEGGLIAKLHAAKRQGFSKAELKRTVRATITRINQLQEVASKLAKRLEELESETRKRQPARKRSSRSKPNEK